MAMSNGTSVSEDDQFGLANIPFGVISTAQDSTPKIATRLYGQVYTLPTLIGSHLLDHLDQSITSSLQQPTLNTFASLGRASHRLVRESLQSLLTNEDPGIRTTLTTCAIPISRISYHLPIHVGDFSDFSCSRDHVLNAGEAVMGVRQLPPGFLHFPIGYGGRSSSILPPGHPIHRPLGQFRSPSPTGSTAGITFGPSRAVDFELEVACVIGKPSKFGQPISIDEADEHIFGFLLLNDWSARDIQGLEMNPLGPFNGKSFGTSISAWIITLDALEVHRVGGPVREAEPALAAYLHPKDGKRSHFAIKLAAAIEVAGVNTSGDVGDVGAGATTVCESKFEWLYWTIGDMIAHQTINGCSLNAGDILATGTISGSNPSSHGCLLEITKGGKRPVALSEGVTRTYLQDNDAVRLTGTAGTPGTAEFIGFGSCYGRLLESIPFHKE